MIRENDVIEIENKNYAVVKTLKYNNSKYAYIINLDNYSDTLFVEEIKKELEIVKKKELLSNLIKEINLKLRGNC